MLLTELSLAAWPISSLPENHHSLLTMGSRGGECSSVAEACAHPFSSCFFKHERMKLIVRNVQPRVAVIRTDDNIRLAVRGSIKAPHPRYGMSCLFHADRPSPHSSPG